jgi:hypothetical protein
VGLASPKGLSVDSAGKLFVAGSFSGNLAFGATSLASAGNSDAFVAKLDPANGFAPLWAVRLGGTSPDVANGVAIDSRGDATAVGSFYKTSTGAAGLVASGTTAPDAFVLKLSGADGSTQFAAHYGDSNIQSADRIAVNRLGTGGVQDLPVYGGTLNGSIDFGSAGLLSTTATATFLLFAAFAP